ncbi:hypothetical protein GT370_05970 [Acidocella sp. MX-AZ03]|uniref:hypothetical protein n=1 Tax=Acidocella sp. MX-AZ03 TaxID=2697363 RepID=UPI0022DE55AD|nr:hypothetical protein [Acidocella sp. MX-AZ03]WBO60351.1 hypothetical protein GT370_05970 [Acidocella sp. MX-AZ03]
MVAFQAKSGMVGGTLRLFHGMCSRCGPQTVQTNGHHSTTAESINKRLFSKQVVLRIGTILTADEYSLFKKFREGKFWPSHALAKEWHVLAASICAQEMMGPGLPVQSQSFLFLRGQHIILTRSHKSSHNGPDEPTDCPLSH